MQASPQSVNGCDESAAIVNSADRFGEAIVTNVDDCRFVARVDDCRRGHYARAPCGCAPCNDPANTSSNGGARPPLI